MMNNDFNNLILNQNNDNDNNKEEKNNNTLENESLANGFPDWDLLPPNTLVRRVRR